MDENLKTRSLSRQLIITIILFSSVITLILTAIQLYLEYQRDTGAIDARLQQVESSYQRSIENAIWDLDKKQVQIQIDGICELPDIKYAEIISDGGLLLSSGTKTGSERTRVRQYDLSHIKEGTNYQLGILTVIANLEGVYDRLLKRLGTVLLSNALKTFLVALFITFLLKRKVIRHLEDVSTFLSQLGANKLDQQFNLDRKKSPKGQQDELSILENSVNQLRSNLSLSLTETQSAEKRYRWLVQNSNEFIYRIGFNEPVPVDLPPEEQVQLIFEQGYAAEWNDALSRKLGYTDEQLAKMTLNELHPLFDKDNLQSIEDFVRSGYRINEAEVHVPDVNGKIFTVLMNLSGVIENDHLIYLWGQDTDVTERLKAEHKLEENLEYLNHLDAVSRALESSNDPDLRIKSALTIILELFDADRAWLLYPNNPDASHFRVPLEVIHPDFPGASASSDLVPMSPVISEMMKTTLITDQPVAIEPPDATLLDHETMQVFEVKSQIIIKLQPKYGQAWLLGLHQCRYARHWSEKDKNLFSEIANRLTDPLGNYISHKELINNQALLSEAQSVAHLGHWDRDIRNDKITWSDEIFRIYGHEPQSFQPTMKKLSLMIHPEDRRHVLQAFRDTVEKPAAMEFRVIRPDGAHRNVSASAKVNKDSTGEPVQIFGIIQDITESKEKELIIKNNEMRMAEAQQISHVGYWDHDLVNDKTIWSDESYRIYGYEPQSFMPDSAFFKSIVHPDDLEQITTGFDTALKEPVSGIFRIIRPDRTQRTLVGTAQVTKTEKGKPIQLFGIIQDITESKEKELAIKNSEARLAEAQKAAHLGHWETDLKNEITIWSDEIFRIYGYEPQSFTPTTSGFYSMVHPDDFQTLQAAFRKSMEEPSSVEFRVIRPDGTQRFIYASAQTTNDENEEPVRLFGIVQDITDRKLLELKNREQELQLIQADKMSSLGLLVSGVAHEINNPNNLIQINASLLDEMWRDTKPVLDKYQAENSAFLIGGLPYGDAIESMPDMITGLTDASRRIERIINDLKNFARRSDQKNLVEISVNEAIESAVRLLKPLIESKTDYLQLDLADDLPSIEGKHQHVEQIIINLLSNALDALPDKKHKVWISSLLDHETGQVLIQIKDNGMGISESDLKNIFDPFFSTKQATGGTGLGLAIAFNLAKEYRGDLSCFSTKDEGTIFTISFPIAKPSSND